MKLNKIIIFPILLLLTSCSGPNMGNAIPPLWFEEATEDIYNEDEYLEIEENDFVDAKENPLSTFSLDSSGAAYSNIRSYLNNGILPSFDQVNIEQMINYFDYDYICKEDENVCVFSELSSCPWNEETKLASIAVKTKECKYEEYSGNNYVFLIDVSGSMGSKNKLPLVKKGFNMLVDKLNKNDRVSIVVYSGKEATIVDGAKGSENLKLKYAINSLNASGSTNGHSAIQSAYKLAKKHFITGGMNQILLATDGDFNVGVSSVEGLKELVQEELNSGVSLSCFGFGMGNYKDNRMQELALNGNGNVFYIDDEQEVERVFGGNIDSITQIVAKDAKIQICFDSNKVEKYRLIGYENRMMSNEDFNNSDVDAGEIYSNRTTIALYEIYTLEDFDSLFNATLRYKDVESNEQQEIVTLCGVFSDNPSDNHIFASIVAEFGLLLRDSKYKGKATYNQVMEIFNQHASFKKDYLKVQFYELVNKAKTLSDKE